MYLVLCNLTLVCFYFQSSDSPSKNSYIGSYYQPPDRILPRPEPPLSMNTPGLSPGLSRTTDAVSSKGVETDVLLCCIYSPMMHMIIQ